MQICYQCGRENHQAKFCAACGSPLALNDYIAKNITEQLAARDRSVLETESSINVFEKAWGWFKLIGAIFVLLLTLLGAAVFWKVSDWRTTVDTAKQSVLDTSNAARKRIEGISSQSSRDISATVVTAAQNIQGATSDAARATVQNKTELSTQTASLRKDIDATRSQLQAAGKLEPELVTLREQLAQANSAIEAQRKELSSSEQFIKHIFSSHAVEYFRVGEPPENRYAVVPPAAGGNRTAVFLLLQSTPIPETLQLQFHVFTQPQNSYVVLAHNLLVFFWADPPDNLKTHQLSVSYFPDKTDNEIIHSLAQRDGRVFADNEPLPKLNQPDPDFKGNKWIRGPAL
jgi:hypothetical protein